MLPVRLDRRWWLAGGVTAVVSVLQRTLGHVTLPDDVQARDLATGDSGDSSGDDADAHGAGIGVCAPLNAWLCGRVPAGRQQALRRWRARVWV